MHAARDGEHETDEHEGLSRHVRENERFGLLWLEVTTVVAVAPVLGMEVETRRISGPPQTSRVVAGHGRGAGIPPTAGDCLDLPVEGASRLRAAHSLASDTAGVLEQAILRPAKRSRRKSLRRNRAAAGRRRSGDGEDDQQCEHYSYGLQGCLELRDSWVPHVPKNAAHRSRTAHTRLTRHFIR